MSSDEAAPPPDAPRSLGRSLLKGLLGFEAFLYGAVALLLAAAAVLVLVGTVHELAHSMRSIPVSVFLTGFCCS
jgi:predicted benzoate:H+ symporter BenE